MYILYDDVKKEHFDLCVTIAILLTLDRPADETNQWSFK